MKWKGIKHCIDCGKRLGDPRSKRCKSCARKAQKIIKYYYCIDCGKEITKRSRKQKCKSCAMKGVLKGERNPMWKGDKVGRVGIHEYIRRRFPKPELCQCCKKVPPYDLANKSGKYKRDLDDWEWLCRRCHMTKDGRLKRLIRPRVKKNGRMYGKKQNQLYITSQ